MKMKFKCAESITTSEPFPSNIGSPHGDGISRTSFNIYFERALRKVREFIFNSKATVEHNYFKTSKLPNELIYMLGIVIL